MSNGKGDSPRNIFTETYRQNYDDIFRKKPLDSGNHNDKKKGETNDKDKTNHGRVREATR